jgi:hypothetical protein
VPGDEADRFDRLDAGESDSQTPDVANDAVGDIGEDIQPDADGGTGESCIDVIMDTPTIFEDVLVGETRLAEIVILNCGDDASLQVDEIRLADDDAGVFHLPAGGLSDDLRDGSLPLEPGDDVAFGLEFEPVDAGEFTVDVEVVNSVTPDAASVQVEGSAIDSGDCPVAKAVALAGSAQGSPLQTTPRTTVDLDALGSSYPAGDDTGLIYEWALIEKPITSRATISDPSLATPTLYLDVAGSYSAEVRVSHPDAPSECDATAFVDIDAIPDSEIYIELTWQTPGDPNPEDLPGTDLDLHYRNPEGDWETKWDTYYGMPNPDWGVQGDASDDPEMVVDATEGHGPEIILHDSPEEVRYEIGVYYFYSHGFGQSEATLRIFIEGVHEFEYLNKAIPSQSDFWVAAAFHGSNPSTIDSPDKVEEGFPESGN